MGCRTVDSETGMMMFLFGLLFIVLIILILRGSPSSPSENYLLNYPTVDIVGGYDSGEEPPLGDFLPTDGDVATGDGGKYELESDGPAYNESGAAMALTCDECTSHCIDYSLKHGYITHPNEGHPLCSKYCAEECA